MANNKKYPRPAVSTHQPFTYMLSSPQNERQKVFCFISVNPAASKPTPHSHRERSPTLRLSKHSKGHADRLNRLDREYSWEGRDEAEQSDLQKSVQILTRESLRRANTARTHNKNRILLQNRNRISRIGRSLSENRHQLEIDEPFNQLEGRKCMINTPVVESKGFKGSKISRPRSFDIKRNKKQQQQLQIINQGHDKANHINKVDLTQITSSRGETRPDPNTLFHKTAQATRNQSRPSPQAEPDNNFIRNKKKWKLIAKKVEIFSHEQQQAQHAVRKQTSPFRPAPSPAQPRGRREQAIRGWDVNGWEMEHIY